MHRKSRVNSNSKTHMWVKNQNPHKLKTIQLFMCAISIVCIWIAYDMEIMIIMMHIVGIYINLYLYIVQVISVVYSNRNHRAIGCGFQWEPRDVNPLHALTRIFLLKLLLYWYCLVRIALNLAGELIMIAFHAYMHLYMCINAYAK